MLNITESAKQHCQSPKLAEIYLKLIVCADDFPDCELQLAEQGHLQLQADKKIAQKPFCIDFNDYIKRLHHIQQHQLQGEFLVKLLGKDSGLQIIDGTAGFGRDSFLMASAGNQIHAYEQNPLIAILLQDALLRSYSDQRINESCSKVSLSCSALELAQMAELPSDAILYIDPMFVNQQRKKVKTEKYSQFLQLLNQNIPQDSSLEHFLSDFSQSPLQTIIIKQSDHDNRDAKNLLADMNQPTRLHQQISGSGFTVCKYSKAYPDTTKN